MFTANNTAVPNKSNLFIKVKAFNVYRHFKQSRSMLCCRIRHLLFSVKFSNCINIYMTPAVVIINYLFMHPQGAQLN